ncbi:hypothetical protein LUZ63_013293 [Rhynchospora breviuscula]|uniref:AAA+ ATPase domain-containing protein n=1 Tax=Rhynchospora breviuscula TaxID=2022672 RepID=A0A9Q0C895_9POAL|nr:hypothetical protein LUZ63_013293 [Rhynchospora breviuscula]
MESVKSTITNTIPEFAGTIVEHAFYPFQVDKRIRDLEWATRDLVALKEDVKTSIEIAERQNSSRTKQVVEWLNKVEIIEKESEEIQENCRKRRRSFWSNYTTSSSAVKKLREIKNLCDQKTTFEVTMHLPPPLAHEMPASSSKSSNLDSALQDIKDDVHGVIGIWGMGGVGKTHLLKQINNELCRDRAFDVVLFVTCSKGCSEEKIKNEIIAKLHLDENGSMEQQQSKIFNFLRERKFVLLLDDLWSRVDLNKIGIPYPMNVVGMCKRKIVLTTRSTEVCGQMEVKKRIRVDVLKWDDAWSLFKEMVTMEIINSDPLIQKYAVDVVNELGGLPLALITIGRAMYDKIDPSEWDHAVVLLKQARLNDVEFSCADQSVFYTLRFSYDSLKNDTLKQCFLHCSLWPEDCIIGKDDLVELWMGLGLIDEPRMQDAYNIGYNYIRRLQAVCLLESGGEYSVKMHDVIRDMAIWIINNQGVDLNRWIVRAGTYDKLQEIIEVFRNTEKLSFMHSHAEEVCLSFTCSSTKLFVLLLDDNCLNNSKSLRLELFSKLTILNLSSNWLEVFPAEICNLVHLQFLNLSWNWFRSLPKELANLTKLKYLHLRGINCTFSKSVLSKLKVLRVLDLSHQNLDIENYIEIFPTIEEDLQCLPNFQTLGITISNMHVFKKFFQTVNVPVRWLNVQNYNESCFSFSSSFLKNFQLRDNLYSLEIKYMDAEFIEFERANANRGNCLLRGLEHLDFRVMWNVKEVIWKSLDPKDVFPRLQTLYFFYCPKLKSISWVVNLPCIRKLQVHGSKVMKQLICINELESSGIIVSQHSFPFLKKLTLECMYELEIISDPIITFPVLEVLRVSDCHKLKKLPFKSSNPPKKLKSIQGIIKWWNNVEMEDGSSKSSLQPFFNKY